MTDNTNDPELEIREAAARDYVESIVQDVGSASEARYALIQEGLARAAEKRASADTSREFDKKVNRMSNFEFNKLVSDISYDTQPRMKVIK